MEWKNLSENWSAAIGVKGLWVIREVKRPKDISFCKLFRVTIAEWGAPCNLGERGDIKDISSFSGSDYVDRAKRVAELLDGE